jgi:hypothetical protein
MNTFIYIYLNNIDVDMTPAGSLLGSFLWILSDTLHPVNVSDIDVDRTPAGTWIGLQLGR